MNSTHCIRRAAVQAARVARITLCACVSAAGLYGCDGGDAHAQQRPGSQATAWGAPYPNMPDIVPPNVRAGVEGLGGGVYMVTDGTYKTMFVVSDVGVILADAPPSMGAKTLRAIQDVAPGAAVVALIYSHAHIDHIGYAGEVVRTNPAMQIVAHEETRDTLAASPVLHMPRDAARAAAIVALAKAHAQDLELHPHMQGDGLAR